MTNELIDPNQPILEKLVKVNGIAFEEQFVARDIGEYLCLVFDLRRKFMAEACVLMQCWVSYSVKTFPSIKIRHLHISRDELLELVRTHL